MTISRRAAITGLLAIASSPKAFAMTEAERRAERTMMAENGGRVTLSPGGATMTVTPVRQDAGGGRREVPVADGSRFAHETPGSIFIDTGNRTLHFVEAPGRVLSYPVAVGREGAQWFGVTRVTHKRKNPEWRPTPNMRRRDRSLPEVVPPGPSNPMGVRAIYLAEGYLRIHGTNAPNSIGNAASAGCYRMFNEDVIDLYERVESGAQVTVLR